MSEFSEKILSLTKKIPRGKITTYSILAKKAGYPGAYRACGTALNNNKKPILIPCHRVVCSNGCVGGYAFGEKRKIALLVKEGITIDDEHIRNFKQKLWT
ncbi:MGMT family protein [Patescibacteria group bacterium]|nr:MGMT family protein [Patescibacteria group bacterium]